MAEDKKPTPRWQRLGLEAVLFVLAFYAVRTCQSRDHPTGESPRFEARTLDGTTVRIGGKSDAPIVLHFWATWCGVCRLEEDNVDALAKRARVITVASRSGSASEVQRYLLQEELSFAVINDPTGTLAQKFGVRAFPSTFFLDREGKITTSEVGYTTTLGLLIRAWFSRL